MKKIFSKTLGYLEEKHNIDNLRMTTKYVQCLPSSKAAYNNKRQNYSSKFSLEINMKKVFSKHLRYSEEKHSIDYLRMTTSMCNAYLGTCLFISSSEAASKQTKLPTLNVPIIGT